MWDNVTVLEEHTSGTPLFIPSSWYTPGKFWYTLGCTIHLVDKHCSKAVVPKLEVNYPLGIMCDSVRVTRKQNYNAVLHYEQSL